MPETVTCPNCDSQMEEGEPCPECTHDGRGDCTCDHCLMGRADESEDDDA